MGKFNFQSVDALVVDDEKFSLKIVSQILKQLGFNQVYEAREGGQALNYLQGQDGNKIKVIIADFNMPQVTGLEMLKQIRVGSKNIKRDLPLIMLTGNTDKHLVSAALALDVDAFIAKPVSKNTLEDRLHKVLSSHNPIKDAKEYRSIDTNVKIAVPADEDEEIEVKGAVVKESAKKERQILLGRVEVGSVLTRPIQLSDGKLILGPNVKITERLLDKLHDLNNIGENIESLWIE